VKNQNNPSKFGLTIMVKMKHNTTPLAFLFCILFAFTCKGQLVKNENLGAYILTEEGASYFAKLSLHCTGCSSPHMLDNPFNKEKNPKKIWPSFYGCYDWHSSVHNHWCLVKLLKLFPNLPEKDQIVARLNFAFDKDRMAIEASRVANLEKGNFEFPYGQSWFLKLAEELKGLEHPKAQKWLRNCKPLLNVIEKKHLSFWPELNEVRLSGSHDSPAMGLSFALDYARSFGRTKLENTIVSAAKRFYAGKENVPLANEPRGYDFMSGYLLVADFMRKVYDEQEFNTWLKGYAPELMDSTTTEKALAIKYETLHTGMSSHWDGFHLNRIWCLNGMLKSLPNLDPTVKQTWVKQMNAMWDYAQESIGKGNYDIDHWLSSFSVFALHGYR
jgi:hypothetical protein